MITKSSGIYFPQKELRLSTKLRGVTKAISELGHDTLNQYLNLFVVREISEADIIEDRE